MHQGNAHDDDDDDIMTSPVHLMLSSMDNVFVHLVNNSIGKNSDKFNDTVRHAYHVIILMR